MNLFYKSLAVLSLLTLTSFARADTYTFSNYTATSGTAVVSMTWTPKWTNGQPGEVVVYNIAWTSDNAVSGSMVVALPPMSGTLVALATIPSFPTPTDNYDITLLDAEGFDVLIGVGANRDDTVAQRTVPLLSTGVGTAPVTINGAHTFKILLVGLGTQGRAQLYMRP